MGVKPTIFAGAILAFAVLSAAPATARPPARHGHVARHLVRVRRVSLRRHVLSGHMSADMVAVDAGPGQDVAPPPMGDDNRFGPVRGRAVHYDHGPPGLSDDVGTVGLVRHF